MATFKGGRSWLTAADGEPDGFEIAARAALADVVRVTAHEVAHALDCPADDPADADTARAWIQSAGNQRDATKIAASHRARWAVMFSIIAGRCQRHFSHAVRGYMGRRTAEGVAAYGHNARALRRAAGRVPRGMSMRDYFASGSPACRRLAAVTTTDAERALIVAELIKPFADSLPAHSDDDPQIGRLAADSVSTAMANREQETPNAYDH